MGCKPAILSILMGFGLLASVCFGKYSGGTGEPNDPYLIETPNDLNSIGLDPCDWDKHFLMIADINMAGFTGEQFNIIGNSTTKFAGVFDGNNHTITNFKWNSATTDDVGLFGWVDDPNAEIKNLRLIAPNVQGDEYVGALVGRLRGGTITGCGVEGGAVSGNYHVGGLAGDIWSSTISNCYAAGSVSGTSRVGGLAGVSYGTISNCYATGDVTGTNDHVGGLAGINNGDISNCYATGSVTGDDHVGGLAGDNWDDTISNCYATGFVSGNDCVGGFAGYNSGTIYVSFWGTESSGVSNGVGSGGSLGIRPKTTAQMHSMSTFLGWGAEPAVWTIDDTNDYPHLAWENSPGESISTLLSDLLEGSGTEQDPYLIYTTNNFDMAGLFFSEWGKHFKIMADIDLNGFSTNEPNLIGCFTGIFDGNGHSISNFTCQLPQDNFIGLFRQVDKPNAEIKDLHLTEPNVDAGNGGYVGPLVGNLVDGTVTGCSAENVSVSGYRHVGGLVGINFLGTIEHCYVTGSVSAQDFGVGGLVGNNHCTIKDCHAAADVAAESLAGGLVGANSKQFSWQVPTIKNCYSTANIKVTVSQAGGLVGSNHEAIVENSCATGGIEGNNSIGGLAGVNYKSILESCYASGPVDGNDGVGGLVGYNREAKVENCYAVGEVSGGVNVGGLVGLDYDSNSVYIKSFWDQTVNPLLDGIGNATDPNVISKLTTEMQKRSTFTDAGWDFLGESVNGTENIWRMCVDGVNYPKLSWEFLGYGDLTCPDGVDFIDYSVLANEWRLERLEQDYNSDGRVNFKDWAIFADNWEGSYTELPPFVACWLARSARIADIAPASGDEFVDWQDLAMLAMHWLEGK